MDNIHSILVESIQRRRIVDFDYNGFHRVVAPCLYGKHTGNGNLILVGYQVGGKSESSAIPGWRSFTVGKIQNIVVGEEYFSVNPPQYNSNDGRFNPIYAKI